MDLLTTDWSAGRRAPLSARLSEVGERVLYLRCMDGHWYRADRWRGFCPIDGWCFGPYEEQVARSSDALTADALVSLEHLQERGFPSEALAEALLMEAGPGYSLPDWFDIAGRTLLMPDCSEVS